MKTKKVNRYYCDYCGKSGGSSYHMKRHEKSCTLNPDRVCRMCQLIGKSEQLPMTELLQKINTSYMKLKKTQEDITKEDHQFIAKLREITSGCPACMLAVIRQLNVFVYNFNYKSEVHQIFKD